MLWWLGGTGKGEICTYVYTDTFFLTPFFGVDLLCGAPKRRELRKACKYAPRFFRIATLRRHLFALPGFIKVHSRTSTVTLIGGGAGNLAWFTGWWEALSRC